MLLHFLGLILYSSAKRTDKKNIPFVVKTSFTHLNSRRPSLPNSLNPLNPTGYYMYHRGSTFTSSTFCPHNVFMCFVTGFYNQDGVSLLRGTYCPHSVFVCFVRIWEQTAIISLYSINWLVFITETECVYCTVRSAHTVYLCVLSGSEKKQRLFHCTTLTDWFL
jgi:hypothetical protein